jgi:hypothetical protein
MQHRQSFSGFDYNPEPSEESPYFAVYLSTNYFVDIYEHNRIWSPTWLRNVQRRSQPKANSNSSESAANPEDLP